MHPCLTIYPFWHSVGKEEGRGSSSVAPKLGAGGNGGGDFINPRPMEPWSVIAGCAGWRWGRCGQRLLENGVQSQGESVGMWRCFC